MIRRAYAIGLLSFATLGFASLPTQAQNVVNTNSQTANQAVVINGDRNRVKLRIIQVNTTNGQSRTDNLSKQNANQAVVINGDRNRVDMRVRQVNVSANNANNRRFNGNRDDNGDRNGRNYNNDNRRGQHHNNDNRDSSNSKQWRSQRS
jgi:hypothetical protein